MTQQEMPVQLALTRCHDYEPGRLRTALIENLGLLGGLEAFVKVGESVMIKPNFIAPKPRVQPAQTDPEMIVQLAILLKEAGARPFVADSPAWGTVADCVQALDLADPLKKIGVPFRQLGRPTWMRVQPSNARVGISSVALEADKIINLPKLKAHAQLGATIAVKNMFGCVSGKAKPFYHFTRGSSERSFCKFLLGVYESVRPALNIIDGITAMEGRGPINGTAHDVGVIVTSEDPFACEMVCSDIIGMEYQNLPILRTAMELGLCPFGREGIAVLGTSPDECVCHSFVHPARIPIKFGFGRVCASIGKQVVRLTAGGIKRLRPGPSPQAR